MVEEKNKEISKVLHQQFRNYPWPHPVMFPPMDPAKQHSFLVQENRAVETTVLVAVLENALGHVEFDVMVFGFGMKTPAEAFYKEVLLPNWETICRDLACCVGGFLKGNLILCFKQDTTTTTIIITFLIYHVCN